MKRVVVVLVAGVVAGVAAYCAIYVAGTARHRAMLRADHAELAWLKEEFNLSEAEFQRVSELHAAYRPTCAEMCQRIEAQNHKLGQLLASTNAMTAEIEAAIAEGAKLRGECQRELLQHCFQVSRTMPPPQGRRYLAWVQKRILLPESVMPMNASAH